MKNLMLKPEEVLCPGEYDQFTPETVRMYFHMDKKGHAADWPQIIVVKSGPQAEMVAWFETKIREFMHEGENRPWEPAQKNAAQKNASSNIFRKVYMHFLNAAEKSPYFLIDGNHRTIAATLAHSPIHSLEVERNEDIGEIEQMVARGDLLGFPHEVKTVDELRNDFIANCTDMYEFKRDGNKNWGVAMNPAVQYVKSFKDRVSELVLNDELARKNGEGLVFPEHMADMIRFYKEGLK
jgi:hypothetical protein